MRVLVGCEESGYIRSAFRRLGHDSWSCDLQPAADGSEQHYKADIMRVLRADTSWDLVILHPECRFLSVSGNRWYASSPEREQAAAWTTELWELACSVSPRVCVEQPVSVWVPPGDYDRQRVQPWMFGYMESKMAVLTTKGLPPLVPLIDKKPPKPWLIERVWKMGPSPERSRLRGHLPWLAQAMAEQWGKLDD